MREHQIRNVIARLAFLADHGDLDEYMEQFTEDAVCVAAHRKSRYSFTEIRLDSELRLRG